MREWTFLTNHGLVFIVKSLRPESTVREIAIELDLTERAVHRILRDLETDGYLVRESRGRGSFYRINEELSLRHPLVDNVAMKDVLTALLTPQQRRRVPLVE